jgi:glycosyltransferase involved in cell wall biosynthesis
MIKLGYLSLLPEPGQPAISGVPKVSETLLRCFESFPDLRVEAITMSSDLAKEQIIEQGNVRYHYLPCSSRWKTATLFRREIKTLHQRLVDLGVEMVHGQPTILFLLAAIGAGLPNVITIHGLMAREAAGLQKLTPFYLQNFVWEAMQCRVVKQARHIISISAYVEEYLKGRTRAHIWPISNPIDAEFFSLSPPVRDGLRMICVGVVSPRKNQVQLVRACQLLASRGIQFECCLLGHISPLIDSEIKNLIRDSGLAKQVFLTGPVSQSELLHRYEWANCVVLPSLEETSPLSLIQAMASGRCVFGARAGGIPALLQNGKYGTLFAADDPEALCAVLRDFLSKPAPYWDLAEVAQVYARETFQPANVAQRTALLYKHILEGGV